MCVCVCTCNLFTLLYRRIQDCKATIFQLKGKKKRKENELSSHERHEGNLIKYY